MHPDLPALAATCLTPYLASVHAGTLSVALDAALAAGGHAYRERGNTQHVEARTAHDVKLALDVTCQQLAEAVLRKSFPDHGVMGEEGGDLDADADWLWIIDPLDGTVNYFNRLPHWCSSVALRERGHIVVGVVFAPMTGECFTATLDGPACLNGKPIRVSSTDSLCDACVLTGLSAILEDPENRMGRLRSILGSTSKIRVLGASALDHCYVAAGRADGLVEYSLHVWDMAAGGLIVDRAGGHFEKVYMQSDLVSGSLSSNGVLHDPLRELFVR